MSLLVNNDTIKKLIQSASLLIKHLDALISKAKVCCDLFTVEAIELRNQLAILCSRSIIADPQQCRKKAEELLWKKCYYDVISSAKVLAKKSPLTSLDKFYLETHIDSGIVKFTEHLLEVSAKLQNLEPAIILQLNVLPIQVRSCSSDKVEQKEDLLDSLQRSLVWLGDLSRYRNDLEISSSLITARRLYHQAIILNPSIGLPFNQLGTLTSHNNLLCYESIFYYLRSIKSPKIFLGAEPNLKALLARLYNDEDKLMSGFAQLVSQLTFKVKEEPSFEVAQLCQLTLSEIQRHLQTDSDACNSLLDIACCGILSATSHRESCFQSTVATAFSCSLFSHLLTKFEELLNLTKGDESQSRLDSRSHNTNPLKNNHEELGDHSDDDVEDEEETRRARLRRRKIALSDDDSSEEEFVLDTDSDESDKEKEQSEEELAVSEPQFMEELRFEITAECTRLLPILKIFTDWFRSNFAIVQVTSNSMRKMWASFANILNVFQNCRRENTKVYEKLPLEEDWKFYGLPAMSSIYGNFDFEHFTHIPKDAKVLDSIRIERILAFGKWLSDYEGEPCFKYVNGSFIYELEETPSAHTDLKDNNRTNLMKNMAQLWLKSEVQELERKLSPQPKRKKRPNAELAHLPYVYVVPDVAAFTRFIRLIKQIVKSQKLIMVIPNVVISEMDQLKKESSAVRDCIRWLETCFRDGNRFIRTQRPNEHEAIPLLTYPKRKDKANWTVFQILECCRYLDTHQRNGLNQEKGAADAPIVLFLTGTMDENEQYVGGLCNSIGVEFRTAKSLLRKEKTKKLL